MRHLVLLLPFVAACDSIDPSIDESIDESTIEGSTPLADDCSPGPIGSVPIYATCADALATTEAKTGCFAIGTPLVHVAKQCTKKRVLIAQLDNDVLWPGGPGPDAAHLNYVLDGIADYFDDNSYGRLVLEFEVAGDKKLRPEERWWIEPSAQRPDLSTAYCDGLIDREVQDYDVIGTLATKLDTSNGTSHGSIEVTCPASAHPKKSVGVWTTFGYREPSETVWDEPPSHEPGHALGLMHDQGFSTLSGRGTYGGLTGEIIEYGGRTSTMGSDGHGVTSGLNLPERVFEGWLNGGVVGAGRHVAAVTSGTKKLTIQNLESDVEGLKGVYLPTTSGGYWIEARRDTQLDPSLQTGLILHYQPTGSDSEKQMVDGTLDTPVEKADALPLGRTYADEANQIYITALAETTTTATLQVERSPRNAHAPIITGITMVPTGPVGMRRFTVTAFDADGDPLSYSWRFGTTYMSGASVDRQMLFLGGFRVFVTVSDRKGGIATGHVDYPSAAAYVANWAPPMIDTVIARPVPFTQWGADNEFVLAVANPVSTEIPAYTWSIAGTTSAWSEPIATFLPQPMQSVPSCLPYSVTMTDTDCPVAGACSKTKSGCVLAPLRLTYDPIGQRATVTYDAALFKNTPTLAWSSPNGCAIVGSGSAVTVGHNCDVRVELTGCPMGGDNCADVFAATMHTF